MEAFSTIFPILFFAFFGFVIFIIVTKRGRNFAINKFLGEIIKDYGIVSEEKIFPLTNQKVRLLKCKKGGKEFFILEARNTTPLSIQLHFVKLSDENARKLTTFLNEK